MRLVVPAAAAVAGPVLERIRWETRDLHRALERASPLMRETVTLAVYRAYLRKLLGFHKPVELMLGALSHRHGLAAAFAGREKAGLIARDLEALGVRPALVKAVRWSPHLPRPSGVGGLFGCAYVLEGATLGGKVLLRRLAPRLPELARASRYLDCYGERAGERWGTFLALMDRRVVGPEAEQAAVDAAAGTFRALERWLGELPGAGAS